MNGIIDGSESTINSFLLPVFRKEFKISDSESSLYGSLLYFSVFIGILFSGIIGDKFGRLRPM
jgi:MFS family permease